MNAINTTKIVILTAALAAFSGCDYTTHSMAVQMSKGVDSIPLTDRNGKVHNLTGGTVDLNFRPLLGWVKVTNIQADGTKDVYRLKLNRKTFDNESDGLSIGAMASETGQKFDIVGATRDTIVSSSTYNTIANCTCTRTECDHDRDRDRDRDGDGDGNRDNRGNQCHTFSYICGTQTLECQVNQHEVTGNINFLNPGSQTTLATLVQSDSYSADAGCTPLTYCPSR